MDMISHYELDWFLESKIKGKNMNSRPLSRTMIPTEKLTTQDLLKVSINIKDNKTIWGIKDVNDWLIDRAKGISQEAQDCVFVPQKLLLLDWFAKKIRKTLFVGKLAPVLSIILLF